MNDLQNFVDAIVRHAPQDGTFHTSIPGMKLIRSSAPTLPMPVVYEPTICFVAQGRKRAMLGAVAHDYDPSRYLIASVGLPIMGSVTQASEAEPYLCLQLDLDMPLLSELAVRHPADSSVSSAQTSGLVLHKTSPALIDAATRLVSLLDTPADVDAIAPLTIREIVYRLLTGPSGDVIRSLVQRDSRLNQIARSIIWIRNNFAGACRIEEGADIAGMSRSTFHLHFKAVTGLTPLEFRTQLRMQEARRLMVADTLDAATAGFRVGYDNPSHFSRDYSRLFGTPPARDASRMRAAAGL